MPDPNSITETEANSIRYFWTDYHNLERMIGWEVIENKLKYHHPELLLAYRQYQLSIEQLNRMTNQLYLTVTDARP